MLDVDRIRTQLRHWAARPSRVAPVQVDDIGALCDEVTKLRAVLEQYADPINWATTHINTPAQVQTVRACWIGPGEAGGDIAREALR